MSKIKYIMEELRKMYIQPFLRKMIGVQQYEEELETLHYIINNGIDITKFPKATGILRDVQIADAEMLRLFHEVCEKYELTYWLDYGTLLGAVRHQGFIPWDDDLDVAMPREDYNKIGKVLSSELSKYGLEVVLEGEDRIAILNWKAGMIMDVFPMDSVSSERIESVEDLKLKLIEYRKFYKKHRSKLSSDEIIKNREVFVGKAKGKNDIWYHNVEFCADGTVYEENTIFPLKKVVFENYMLWVPNDCDLYLKEIYGQYMDFPKNGVLHHNATSNKIYENAIKKGVDLKREIERLKNISII